VVLANLGSESERCVGSRSHLVGVSISFEKNFYRLPFTPPLSGSPFRSFRLSRNTRPNSPQAHFSKAMTKQDWFGGTKGSAEPTLAPLVLSFGAKISRALAKAVEVVLAPRSPWNHLTTPALQHTAQEPLSLYHLYYVVQVAVESPSANHHQSVRHPRHFVVCSCC
jgi:hypothetical protein